MERQMFQVSDFVVFFFSLLNIEQRSKIWSKLNFFSSMLSVDRKTKHIFRFFFCIWNMMIINDDDECLNPYKFPKWEKNRDQEWKKTVE